MATSTTSSDYSIPFAEFANSMLSTDSIDTVYCRESTTDDDYGVVYLEEQYDSNVKELFKCYTTFLVTRKYSIEKIRELRMKSIIENYIHLFDIDGKLERDLLCKNYEEHVIDTFDKKLNAPKCFFAEARRERIAQEISEKKERDTDDIAHHYKGITDKYKYMYAVSQQSPHQSQVTNVNGNGKNEDDSDVLSDNYRFHYSHNSNSNNYDYDEDNSHCSYSSDYNYDENFSNTDSDYLSD
jgi:hypothetical protein